MALISSIQWLVRDSESQRMTKLSNGWYVFVMVDINNAYGRFYVSKDNGASWSSLAVLSATCNTIAIGSYGTTVYAFFNHGATDSLLRFLKFDATAIVEGSTLVNGTSGAIVKDVYTFYSNVHSLSIAVNPSNGHITGAFSTRTSGSTASYNIYSYKSVDGGVTLTKQDGTAGYDSLTSYSSSSINCYRPFCTYMSNGYVMIAYDQQDTLNAPNVHSVTNICYTAGGWQAVNNKRIFNHLSYDQTQIFVLSKKNGSNIGRLYAVWQGSTDTYPANRQIQGAYSDDYGVTWTQLGSLTAAASHNTRPILTEDGAGNVTCFYANGNGIYGFKCNNGTTTFTSMGGAIVSDYYSLGGFSGIDPIFAYQTTVPSGVSYSIWTPPAMSVNVGGAWKAYAGGWVNISGAWKQIDSIWVNVGGSWKKS